MPYINVQNLLSLWNSKKTLNNSWQMFSPPYKLFPKKNCSKILRSTFRIHEFSGSKNCVHSIEYNIISNLFNLLEISIKRPLRVIRINPLKFFCVSLRLPFAENVGLSCWVKCFFLSLFLHLLRKRALNLSQLSQKLLFRHKLKLKGMLTVHFSIKRSNAP